MYSQDDQVLDSRYFIEQRLAEREERRQRRLAEQKQVAVEKEKAIDRLRELLAHGSVVYSIRAGATVRRNGQLYSLHIPVENAVDKDDDTQESRNILNITKDIAKATDHSCNPFGYIIIRGLGSNPVSGLLEQLSWVLRPKGDIKQKFKISHCDMANK